MVEEQFLVGCLEVRSSDRGPSQAVIGRAEEDDVLQRLYGFEALLQAEHAAILDCGWCAGWRVTSAEILAAYEESVNCGGDIWWQGTVV